MKNKILLLLWGILFFIGNLIILESSTWNLGTVVSMNLSGSIISIFSGIGFLAELYLNKNKQQFYELALYGKSHYKIVILEGILNSNWVNLSPNISCLVLLIRSKSHEAVSDEDFIKMQYLLKNCIAYEMSHPDHNIHLANKGEFYKYFDEFLRRV